MQIVKSDHNSQLGKDEVIYLSKNWYSTKYVSPHQEITNYFVFNVAFVSYLNLSSFYRQLLSFLAYYWEADSGWSTIPQPPQPRGKEVGERANPCRGAGKNVDIKFSGGGQRGPSKRELWLKKGNQISGDGQRGASKMVFWLKKDHQNLWWTTKGAQKFLAEESHDEIRSATGGEAEDF